MDLWQIVLKVFKTQWHVFCKINRMLDITRCFLSSSTSAHTHTHKEQSMSVSLEHLQCYCTEGDVFRQWIMVGDEMWCCHFEALGKPTGMQ